MPDTLSPDQLRRTLDRYAALCCPGPGSPRAAAGADAGPDDGPSDFAADRGGTLRETSWANDRPADHQRRRAQGGVGGFHYDARVGNALQGLTSGGTVDRLDIWLNDARASGIYGMRRFVRTLRQDINAVRNAVLEPWINGQTESQINRLKTLKRGMYGRAGVDLLRVRMLPLQR